MDTCVVPDVRAVPPANAKLAEAQKLHDGGKHADSVKMANEALTLLGVTPGKKQ